MTYYIIYDEATGEMDGGHGRFNMRREVDLDAKGDQSNTLAMIRRIRQKHPARRVIYINGLRRFDPDTQKIFNGQVVEKTAEDIAQVEAEEAKEAAIREEIYNLGKQAYEAKQQAGKT